MTTALFAAIVTSGLNVYKRGRYPRNVNSVGFPSARMESLSFLHGEFFEELCSMLELSSAEVLEKNGIPEKSIDCQCEECKTDYSVEYKLMGGECSLAPGKKHYVIWKNKRMVHIEPQ